MLCVNLLADLTSGNGARPRKGHLLDPSPGQLVSSKYRITRLLGRGGMDAVPLLVRDHEGCLVTRLLPVLRTPTREVRKPVLTPA